MSAWLTGPNCDLRVHSARCTRSAIKSVHAATDCPLVPWRSSRSGGRPSWSEATAALARPRPALGRASAGHALSVRQNKVSKVIAARHKAEAWESRCRDRFAVRHHGPMHGTKTLRILRGPHKCPSKIVAVSSIVYRLSGSPIKTTTAMYRSECHASKARQSGP